jgi:hypothetical protein
MVFSKALGTCIDSSKYNDELVNSGELTFFAIFVILDRLQEEPGNFNRFWMPVEDPGSDGDQVPADNDRTHMRASGAPIGKGD